MKYQNYPEFSNHYFLLLTAFMIRPMSIVSLLPGAKEGVADIINWLNQEGVEKGKIIRWMLPA